jgi:SAM-dependent methyltransferase
VRFKDLFSAGSADYARFRPTYPAELFAWLASVAPDRRLAVDLATGNGQAALGLAPHFARVVALDASRDQLAAATPAANVVYDVAQAEATGLDAGGADLVTAAQAFHWFRQEPFFAEVRRVLRPSGVLAIWCYGVARITPEVDAVVTRLYGDVLGPYWEPERRMVEDGYRNVRFPFPEIAAPALELEVEWDLARLAGYLRTWSALKAYARDHGSDPLVALEEDLLSAWGEASTRPVRWSLTLRAFRRD